MLDNASTEEGAAVDPSIANRQYLKQILEIEHEALVSTLRIYAWRAGLPGYEEAALELLNALTVEALDHASRYDPARPARAWLLGIATNLIRQRQAEFARLYRREPLAGDLSGERDAGLDEEELFDRLSRAQKGPEQEVEARQEMQAALALLSPADRQIVCLFAEGGWDGESLARALHISHGAARVRLHRALARLRQIWPHQDG